MISILFFLFSVRGVLIISTAKTNCTEKHLPFPAVCATNCLSTNEKPFCIYSALSQYNSSSQNDEIIIYADNDILFSNSWNETRLSEFIDGFGDNKIVLSGEALGYPMMKLKNQLIEGPYVNSGLIIGRRKIFIEMMQRLAEVAAKKKIVIYNTKKIIENLEYPSWTERRFTDQAFIAGFYWASPNKPFVKDDDRKLGFNLEDLEAWIPQNEAQYETCALPSQLPEIGMPGDDVCDTHKGKGVRDRGIGVCWTKNRRNGVCPRALEIDECFIRLNFLKNPLGVLQNVEDPLMVHFAGRKKKNIFREFVIKQNENCKSPYRYQGIEVPELLAPTSLILTAIPAVENIPPLLHYEFDEKKLNISRI
eukprot:GHVP01018148.1.p1 GENE.GHVP01018148.1~~GHVP01018148.1.p1  ORF type:complete len:364 (+),score=59.21 GHVP01018148.1:225-1316(+)